MQCNRYGYLTVDCVTSGVLPDVRAVQPARQDDRGHGADGHLLHPRPLPRLPLLQETKRPTSPGRVKQQKNNFSGELPCSFNFKVGNLLQM